MVLLEVIEVYKGFAKGNSWLDVLQGVTVEVNGGEMVAVVGPSGSGKSTLLHLIGALERPDRGTIRFDGRDVFQQSELELAAFRNRHVGFVFQFHHLLPELTALENVMLPGLIARRGRREVMAEATELLATMGLAERMEHRPGELSGGEQQRVAIARALVNHPDLVLADEPTGNLDRQSGEAIQGLLRSLNQTRQQTFIVVTHNEAFAKALDRTVRLIDGKLFPC
ncbi:MAG TPA: ABC transporter ATP-binding protein [Alphaproteobacteria bacterium]|nr:ABC transporter ATP-binding protein [Alphaproteobacteria bacterium]